MNTRQRTMGTVALLFAVLTGFAAIFQIANARGAYFYFTGGPVASWDQPTDTVIVTAVPFITSEGVDTVVPKANVSAEWFVVYPVNGSSIVAQGNLSFNGGQWGGNSSTMAWHNGVFYTVAFFTVNNGTTLVSPAGNTFTRSDLTENIIIYVGAIGIAILIAIIVIVIIRRRGSGVKPIEKPKEKEIKVLKVGEGEIKKAKKSKASSLKPEKKEPEKKGVTKKSDEFIFEVPKWEDEDEEGK